MAFLPETYSTDTLPESTASDPIPAGWYTAAITQAELKDTHSGTGQYIKLRYDITGPSQQGRVVFGNLNIRNANPKAESIGLQQLGELMRAIGMPRLSDTDQLIGAHCSIKVAVREDKSGQYQPQNEVKGWKALDGSKPPMAPAAMPKVSAPAPAHAPSPAPAPAASSSAPPWAKR